jgi:hypothetical protein
MKCSFVIGIIMNWIIDKVLLTLEHIPSECRSVGVHSYRGHG